MMKILPAFLTVLFTLFLFSIATAHATNDDPIVSELITQGGLTCFTITPSEEVKDRASCDALCGQRDAACTGVTNGAYNPPTKCEDPPPIHAAVCRCCKVQ